MWIEMFFWQYVFLYIYLYLFLYHIYIYTHIHICVCTYISISGKIMGYVFRDNVRNRSLAKPKAIKINITFMKYMKLTICKTFTWEINFKIYLKYVLKTVVHKSWVLPQPMQEFLELPSCPVFNLPSHLNWEVTSSKICLTFLNLDHMPFIYVPMIPNSYQ